MNKEEFFTKNFEIISNNISNKQLDCFGINCRTCYYNKDKGCEGNNKKLEKDFNLFARKKKIENLLR